MIRCPVTGLIAPNKTRFALRPVMPILACTSERTTVMEIFLDLFGAQNIACLLGDREFVGREWFRFLKRHRIKFQMRLHKNTLVRNGRGQYAHAWRLFCRTRINCPLVIPEARKMWGLELYLSGC